MTRLSITLPNSYPRKFIWWMECDVCHESRSRPAWTELDLTLDGFRALGWECQSTAPMDTCPKCLNRPASR